MEYWEAVDLIRDLRREFVFFEKFWFVIFIKGTSFFFFLSLNEARCSAP